MIGYARVSTQREDGLEQRKALIALGVQNGDIYVDFGWTEANFSTHGLDEAIRAVGAQGTLVVTTLHRLARSLADAREVVAELARIQARLIVEGKTYGGESLSEMSLSSALTMCAQFEADIASARTREGLEGTPRTIGAKRADIIQDLWDGRTPTWIAAQRNVSRSTVYRISRQPDVTRRKSGAPQGT